MVKIPPKKRGVKMTAPLVAMWCILIFSGCGCGGEAPATGRTSDRGMTSQVSTTEIAPTKESESLPGRTNGLVQKVNTPANEEESLTGSVKGDLSPRFLGSPSCRQKEIPGNGIDDDCEEKVNEVKGQILAPPDEPVNAHIPDIPYSHLWGPEFEKGDGMPLWCRVFHLSFKDTTTVQEANELLQKLGASVVGAAPSRFLYVLLPEMPRGQRWKLLGELKGHPQISEVHEFVPQRPEEDVYRPAPKSVHLTPADRQITVFWDEHPEARANIYFSSTPGLTRWNYPCRPEGTKISNVSLPFTISGLTNGRIYYFLVTKIYGKDDESRGFGLEEKSAVPGLSQITGSPDDPVNLHIPDIPIPVPDTTDFTYVDGVPFSRRTFLIIFKEESKTKEANDILASLAVQPTIKRFIIPIVPVTLTRRKEILVSVLSSVASLCAYVRKTGYGVKMKPLPLSW